MMDATSYSLFRKKVKHYMKQVAHSQEPVMITRKNNRNVILISVEEYSNLLENQFILSHLESRAWVQAQSEETDTAVAAVDPELDQPVAADPVEAEPS